MTSEPAGFRVPSAAGTSTAAPPRRASMALALAFVLPLAASASTASASEVIVPDDYPTIALAIGSGADTVSVRQGTYAEALSFTTPLVLRGLGPDGPAGPGYPGFDQPVVTSVNAGPTAHGTIQILDLHVTGTAFVDDGNGGDLVQGCRFDSGLTLSGYGMNNKVEYCHVFGNLDSGGALGSDFGWNTITGGHLSVGDQGTKHLHDNVVMGPAAYGISAGEDCVVQSNTVSGCTLGISASTNTYLSGNLVEDCSGSGYTAGSSRLSGTQSLFSNTARRCGARGFDLWSVAVVAGNLVDSTGQEGILLRASTMRKVVGNTVLRAGTTGISASYESFPVTGNRVIGAGGDGIAIGWCDTISGNVVGRSLGRGIVTLAAPNHGYRVRNNTVYLNGGAGFDLVGGSTSETDSIANNIGEGNALGLHWSTDPALPHTLTPAVPLLACNDWFDNASGDVSGTAPSGADVSLDPLFCAIGADDVGLGSSSPLASLAGCGLVGALGVGCTTTAAVAPVGNPAGVHLSVSPQPGRGPIRFSWRPGNGVARLEVYDVSGARRWSDVFGPGQSSVQWSGTGVDGQSVPAGLYFARLAQGAAQAQARVILVK